MDVIGGCGVEVTPKVITEDVQCSSKSTVKGQLVIAPWIKKKINLFVHKYIYIYIFFFFVKILKLLLLLKLLIRIDLLTIERDLRNESI